MKKVLILGAGLVSKPIITYLLNKGYFVTVASLIRSKAEEMTQGHPNSKAIAWSVEETEVLDEMISSHDIAVSLLPWVHHVLVAKYCIKNRKDLVTTSYVKPEMRALDQEAKDAGIIILKELGLDPGIDHMSAMRIIDKIHGKGGNVEEFYSICGALPAPEAANNPFKYKFSWSPKGVVMAANNEGKYLRHGKIHQIPTEDLFKNPIQVFFPNVGNLEVYPNRDSLPYIDLYGIPETKTMFRGTFRYEGWCETLDAIKSLKLISNDKYNLTGKTYAEMVAMLIGEKSVDRIKEKVAGFTGLPVNSIALKALEWLGIFDQVPMGRETDSPFEVISDLMIEKMEFGVDERDMVVMQHVFLASYPDGSREVIKSTMLDFGSQETDTAVARTVALPAALGVELVLSGKIESKGVQIPVLPSIYNPILDSLETLNIRMIEQFGLPVEENIL
ncbi:MAG TPA: saccharopine dehydrogenase C-terminal domain-containing protein [Bacteroidales bacterium]|nr:saccharopine dehydrogenase C-terminal domain-containing protein [Bacteroidales bacterium]